MAAPMTGRTSQQGSPSQKRRFSTFSPVEHVMSHARQREAQNVTALVLDDAAPQQMHLVLNRLVALLPQYVGNPRQGCRIVDASHRLQERTVSSGKGTSGGVKNRAFHLVLARTISR